MAGRKQPHRVAEFYAGIGGFHYALLDSGHSQSEIVASVDINTNTTAIYAHNFPSSSQMRRNICGMTASDLVSLKADVFFLSPPCQPFTRQGCQRDNKDRRTDSFFHLMHTLKEMHHKPNYLLLENVKGFEVSRTRDEFVGILRSLGYEFQEFLLSPVQFGIPNSRLRFYLLAKKHPFKFAHKFAVDSDNPSPIQDAKEIIKIVLQNSESTDEVASPIDVPSKNKLSNYLEHLDNEEIKQHLVPDKILSKYAIALDIVRDTSSTSCCFTKGYGNYAVGTGSILQQSLSEQDFKDCFEKFTESGGDLEKLRSLDLRYFTAREVANLMCFPAEFTFPEYLTNRQCYMALGNSLNVKVVSFLIQYLFL